MRECLWTGSSCLAFVVSSVAEERGVVGSLEDQSVVGWCVDRDLCAVSWGFTSRTVGKHLRDSCFVSVTDNAT